MFLTADELGDALPDFSANVLQSIPVQAGGLYPISDVWHIDAGLRDQLILPAYSALQTLQFSGDAAALEASRHTLAAMHDYLLVALRDAKRPTDEIEAGLRALMQMISRQVAGHPFRATAAELESLRAAVRHADDVLGTLRTDQIITAVAKVNAAIDAGGAVC